FVSSDFCVFSPQVFDDFAAALKAKTGIERQNVLWTVTHTHSAPELGPPGVYEVLLKGRSDHPWDREYLQFVQDKLIAGIEQARAALRPARVGFAWGKSNANINRRAQDLDGTISLGNNPDRAADRHVGLMRVDGTDGRTMALIANYPMHATVLGPRMLQISGDAPGIVASHVEEKLGNGALMLYVNGAAGDLAPIYSVTDSPKAGHLGEFRVLLGEKILEANKNLKTKAITKLKAQERWIETPRKEGIGWPPELGTYTNAANGNIRIPGRIVEIGDDAVIWSAPVELFNEIASTVREKSPFAYTFYFGYTNGWLGYLPVASAFAEGGYEPRTSPFTARAEPDLRDQVLGTIERLKKKR
ncbi:MAG: neutral/alkaline non-lysosomal ceramidase N-terminal domain-containing protein, partial [Acidobacteria bacterium]|nr:neutral/alkaline non-lysosomal ceramidase N-terminal domain-containing protein [Acidobacteriota bacterium]